MSDSIKTWQERLQPIDLITLGDGTVAHRQKAVIEAKDAELADLRARVEELEASLANRELRLQSLTSYNADKTARIEELEAELSRRPAAAAEVAAEQPKLRHSEAYVADLEDSLKQVASLLDVKGGADDLIAAVKRLVAAEQPAAEPELLPLLQLVQREDRYHQIARRIKAAAENKWNEVFQIEMAELIAYIGHIARAHLSAQGSKDSERLDFLIASLDHDWSLHGESGKGYVMWDTSNGLVMIAQCDTARETIDAAMKAGAQGVTAHGEGK